VTSALDTVVAAAILDQRASLAAIALPSGLDNAAEAAARSVIAEAFLFGYRVVMVIAALLALSSAATAWLTIEPFASSKEPAAKSAAH
jgi:hypothetical protein